MSNTWSEASYCAQDAAIAMATERGDKLLFRFVVDVEFLNRTARAVRPDIIAAEIESETGVPTRII